MPGTSRRNASASGSSACSTNRNLAPAVVEDVGQFGRREPDIEGQQDAVRFEHTVVRLEQAVAVGAEERHAVAAARPFGTECPGQAGCAIGELGVGEALVAADDRQIAGELLACVAKKPNRGERHVHVDLLDGSRLTAGSQQITSSMRASAEFAVGFQ